MYLLSRGVMKNSLDLEQKQQYKEANLGTCLINSIEIHKK